MKLKYDCIPLLSKSELPWVKYHLAKNTPGIEGYKKKLREYEKIQGLISDLKSWEKSLYFDIMIQNILLTNARKKAHILKCVRHCLDGL
jgi:hypothetical protein